MSIHEQLQLQKDSKHQLGCVVYLQVVTSVKPGRPYFSAWQSLSGVQWHKYMQLKHFCNLEELRILWEINMPELHIQCTYCSAVKSLQGCFMVLMYLIVTAHSF